jgi:putative ABC transport system substrate-binding protein
MAACGSSSSSSAPSTALAQSTAATPASASAKIGVFLVEKASILDAIAKGFDQGFLNGAHLTARQVEFQVQNAEGDQSLIQSIARNFAESNVNEIAVIGTPAVIAMAKATSTKPIIAVAMGDPVGAKVAKSLDAPGGNVTGTIDFVDPAEVLNQILRVKPAPSTVGTIYNPSNENSQVWVAALKQAVKSHPGLSLREAAITSSGDAAIAARSLEGQAQAVLIGPDADAIAALPAIASAAQQAKEQLYLVGGDVTTAGVLASIGPNYPQLGEQAGAIAAEVHAGKAPSVIPFGRPSNLTWQVNKQTATKLGVTLPAGVGSAA